MLSLMKNESCMKAVSWDVFSKQQPKLRPWSCGNVFLSAVNHVWGRKQYSSPRISWKVSSPSHCSARGSAQHGPELCYSQGAWRLGNMTAKSVNCISHRSLNNQQKRIICSQTWSSKVQIRNRIKTPSVQGHLPSFSSVAWRPHSILLSPLTLCSAWPWAVPDAWGRGKPTSLRKCAFSQIWELKLNTSEHILMDLHWQILRDSAQISLTFKNVHSRYCSTWYLSMSLQQRYVPGSAGESPAIEQRRRTVSCWKHCRTTQGRPGATPLSFLYFLGSFPPVHRAPGTPPPPPPTEGFKSSFQIYRHCIGIVKAWNQSQHFPTLFQKLLQTSIGRCSKDPNA